MDAAVLENTRKTFGQHVAVENLSLTIPSGSVYGFIGPNGAGKTTTIRMIMNILIPDRGSVTVLGEPVVGRLVAGVVCLRPVDGDEGDPVTDLVDDAVHRVLASPGVTKP